MISAMDEQEVGCPDPAAVVDSTEWILNLLAMSLRTCSSCSLRDMIAEMKKKKMVSETTEM